MYVVLGIGFRRSWLAYRVSSSLIRPGEKPGLSKATSAVPASTDRACATGAFPSFQTIASGYPSGWAACDQTRKCGLRTSFSHLPGLYFATLYGPVAGGGCRPRSLSGVVTGTAEAKGKASL